MSGLRPVSFSSFGTGLNLKDQPFLVDFSASLDCMNVEFTTRGSVKQRAGYAQFTPSELTNQPDSMTAFYKTDATKRLLVGNGNRIDALDTSGASIANTAAPTASPHYFARFGGPTIEAIYYANGTDPVARYDTAGGFTAPAGLAGQSGRFLAVTPTSNRLMVARESGATAGNNPSSVNFSDAGVPETFTATNYVDLDPGDGESIMGMVAFRDMVFVLKETKFFVYYGESTDSTGQPVFNFRKVNVGIGLAASRALCTGRDGVYFMGRDGVYMTTGGEPTLVSSPIDPFFQGNPSIYFGSNVLDHGNITQAAMCWHAERLYLAVPAGSSTSNTRMLVFDPRYGWWSQYDIPAAALCPFRISSETELVFAAPTSTNYIYRHKTGSGAYGADAMSTTGTNGTAIASRWTTGWTDLGSEDEKAVRRMELYGTGACTVAVRLDYEFTGGYSQDITFTGAEATWDTSVWDTAIWGPVAVSTHAAHDSGYQATTFSLAITNSTINTTWALNIATFQMSSQRPTGVK